MLTYALGIYQIRNEINYDILWYIYNKIFNETPTKKPHLYS